MGIPHSLFEEKLENLKNKKGVTLDTDLTASDLSDLVEQYKNVYLEAKGENFPSGAECNATNFTFCCYTFSWSSPLIHPHSHCQIIYKKNYMCSS